MTLELTKKEVKAIMQALCCKHSFDIEYKEESKDYSTEAYKLMDKLEELTKQKR